MVTLGLSRSFQLLNFPASFLRTTGTVPNSMYGTVNAATLARSTFIEMPDLATSYLSVSMPLNRVFHSVGTNSSFTPRSLASSRATSMSCPAYSLVLASRKVIGRKSPVVPTRSTPLSSTRCSRDLAGAGLCACAGAASASAATTPSARRMLLLCMDSPEIERTNYRLDARVSTDYKRRMGERAGAGTPIIRLEKVEKWFGDFQ